MQVLVKTIYTCTMIMIFLFLFLTAKCIVLNMKDNYISNSLIYFLTTAFMQMVIFAQLTLFDQMIMICNTPCP